MIRLGMIVCMMVFALNAFAAQGVDACSGQAQSFAQSNGGDPSTVVMTFSSVEGFTINDSGDAVYTFQRGAQTCVVSYDVFSTYFQGTKCELENYNCPTPKTRGKRR